MSEFVELPEDKLSAQEKKQLEEEERKRLEKQQAFIKNFLKEIELDSRVSYSQAN